MRDEIQRRRNTGTGNDPEKGGREWCVCVAAERRG